MPNRISDSQEMVLNFIKQMVTEKGYPPSVREICQVGIKSTSTVHGHLEKLEKAGLIRKDPTKPRAIEILDETTHLSKRNWLMSPL